MWLLQKEGDLVVTQSYMHTPHAITYRFSLFNCFKHQVPVFIIFFVLLKFLLALGEQHTTKVGGLLCPVRCGPFYLDRRKDLAEVCIGNTKAGLF